MINKYIKLIIDSIINTINLLTYFIIFEKKIMFLCLLYVCLLLTNHININICIFLFYLCIFININIFYYNKLQ